MRLFYDHRMVLNSMTGGVLRKEKKGRLETQRQSGIGHVKTEAGIRIMSPQTRSHEKLEEAKKDPPLERRDWKDWGPANTWISDF